MKLLLLNNISNIIRSSIDTSKIIKSALEELVQLFALFRAYYAVYSKDMNSYIINYKCEVIMERSLIQLMGLSELRVSS